MPLPTFRLWLDRRLQQVPDAGALALLIARSGAAGVSRKGLSGALGVPEETVENLLRGLVASGQVTVLQRNGQLVYRAAG
jgi:CRP-like cAMP-binding protein